MSTLTKKELVDQIGNVENEYEIKAKSGSRNPVVLKFNVKAATLKAANDAASKLLKEEGYPYATISFIAKR